METKGPPALEHRAGRTTEPIVEAYLDIVHLKSLFRQGWLRCGIGRDRCESVAEHTFGVAMLAMLLGDQYHPELDAARVMRLALLHDIGEIHAGDLTPYHDVSHEEKKRRERESVAIVLGRIPGGDRYLADWDEYASGASPEARFVKVVDRLELLLQAAVYEHSHDVDLEEFFSSVASELAEPRLAPVVEAIGALRRPSSPTHSEPT